MEAETTGIMISSGAVGAICTLIGAWLKSKVGTKIKRPIDSDDTYVTCGQCKQHRDALNKRIDEQTTLLRKIPDMIEDMDRKAEKRSVDLHRRIDPIVRDVACSQAAAETAKQIVASALSNGTRK